MTGHKENALVGLAWVASVTLSQWQAVVGIASGLAVLVYTLFRIFYLVRDKTMRRDE